MHLSQNVRDFAASITRDCDIDSTCVFISDKTTRETKLYYLGNFGVSEEILDRYNRRGICDVDPFTDPELFESPQAGDGPRFHISGDPGLAAGEARAKDYWQFVSEHGFEVVGASTMRLQPKLYLLIGAHRHGRRSPGGVPFERLAFGMEALHNRIASHLLTSLITDGGGYRTLVGMVSPDQAREHGYRALSPREMQVADLVCQGKQNKEIAWLIGLAECTVENHLRRIYQKLGIHNRAALVARMNRGLH